MSDGWFHILQSPADVDKTPPVNGDVLVYDDSVYQWKPTQLNTIFDAVYLRLDQSTPLTGLSASQAIMTDSNKKLVSVDYLDQAVKTTSSPTFKNLTVTKTIVIDGSLANEYSTNPVKKIPFQENGAGITITHITVDSYEASPAAQVTGDIKYCDTNTGVFPDVASATLVRAIDTTTGNYDSGAVADAIPTGKTLYLSQDAAPTGTTSWTIKIIYTIN